ncbi:sugar/nucleoside kinase (ribokinase family) [Aminobacter niigataensis]|uniref:Sugar/nucleoside kinase (Ribokinase family) n=1 Tax=Aminobacter niigataensis TaxID=83265 RepID=A0ABR6L321_9HYPH|nr:carbohydrate kinase family protein [Aminobacter niigataensis]MBB4651197.1 sugar/nucleoside kinase (ribokinase family) [Aminobacter niigataensis]
MTVPTLLVLGNVNVDLVLGEVDGWPAVGTEVVVDRSEMRPGGSAGNTALALAGMGEAHLMIASVGNDPNGAWLSGQFDAASCEWIVEPCDTTLTVGIVHKGGDRVFFTTPGHLQRASLEDLIERLPQAPGDNALALISGGHLMPRIEAGTTTLLEALSAKGWRTAIDPGWPPVGWTEANKRQVSDWIAAADISLINAEEAKGLAGVDDLDTATALLVRQIGSAHTLVVKDGAQGAHAYAGGEHFHAASPRVEVIDTVGAGDTFNAAFLASLAKGGSLGAALARGVETAARAISTFPRRYSA